MSANLRVDWCGHEAAEYAIMHWHYSKRMPMGKLIKVGAWEDNRFIGCVVFSNGSSRFLGVQFGLEMLQVSELARVALNTHSCATSQVVAIATRMMKKHCPLLRLIVSFADPMVGHNGTLYQAANWTYAGRGSADARVRRYIHPNGQIWQWRSLAKFLHQHHLSETVEKALEIGFVPLDTEPKHRYLYPLDRAMRKQIAPLAKPYPKRQPCGPSVEGDTSDDQLEGAGSIPATRSEA